MGCTASKLENEDTVRRCKDRRRLMKEAVYARNLLAAAHSDYCHSLRRTGSALCTFAAGEPLSVSDDTPAVFLNPKPNPSTTTTTASAASNHHHPPPPLHIPSPSPSLHPPPPPPFNPSPSPTIRSSKLPHILSSSSTNIPPSVPRRRKPPPKLPHILSDSSPSSTPGSNFYPTAFQANSTYSSTPSQTSSVWNWDNFYPPPTPPGSDYFNHLSTNHNQQQQQQPRQRQHFETETAMEGGSGSDSEPPSEYNLQQRQYDTYGMKTKVVDDRSESEYDFFHRKDHSQTHSHHHLDDETEREEVQCSEWGDRYSTSSSSDEEGEVDMGSEIGTRSNFGSSVRAESIAGDPVAAAAAVGKGKSDYEAASTSARSYRTGEMMDMKMVVRHKDLKEIVEAIKENFEKAAVAGDQVSEMLEISKAQLDRSFRQLRSKMDSLMCIFFTLQGFGAIAEKKSGRDKGIAAPITVVDLL